MWFLPGDVLPGGVSEGGYRVGTALDGDIQAGMEVTSPHAQIGKECWVALPTADNISDRPLTLLRGEITRIPKGLKITGYKALSHEDTDGHPLRASPGRRLTRHSGPHHAARPLRIQDPSRAAPEGPGLRSFTPRARIARPVRCRARWWPGVDRAWSPSR
ncbi:hypothetical protein GCM10023086_67830 [Streptomyces venetus]|uniref:Uncharacterized protein n=1 Tax=Streptomyces venetus TaxID=1701086 RepID=A0ABP8H770_9ACTN